MIYMDNGHGNLVLNRTLFFFYIQFNPGPAPGNIIYIIDVDSGGEVRHILFDT